LGSLEISRLVGSKANRKQLSRREQVELVNDPALSTNGVAEWIIPNETWRYAGLDEPLATDDIPSAASRSKHCVRAQEV
jgi:hypothetical protein